MFSDTAKGSGGVCKQLSNKPTFLIMINREIENTVFHN